MAYLIHHPHLTPSEGWQMKVLCILYGSALLAALWHSEGMLVVVKIASESCTEKGAVHAAC